jgi:hypothetical protein
MTGNAFGGFPAIVTRKQITRNDFKHPGHSGFEPSTCSKRLSRLEGRTKQRRFAKPYSRSNSTTLAPMKPLEPVTRMRSPCETMYSEVTAVGGLEINLEPRGLSVESKLEIDKWAESVAPNRLSKTASAL